MEPGQGRGERLSGAGWDPDREAEMLEQSWAAGCSLWCTLSLHIPRTPQASLRPCQAHGTCQGPGSTWTDPPFWFYALLQLGSRQ